LKEVLAFEKDVLAFKREFWHLKRALELAFEKGVRTGI
jgi:hypothetical protein